MSFSNITCDDTNSEEPGNTCCYEPGPTNPENTTEANCDGPQTTQPHHADWSTLLTVLHPAEVSQLAPAGIPGSMAYLNSSFIFPTQPPMNVSPGHVFEGTQIPNGPQGAPGNMPYFRDNLLVFPSAGVGLHAQQTSDTRGIDLGVEKRSKTIEEEVKKQLAAQQNIEKQKQLSASKEKQDTKWFKLPENTYGAGLWAILVLEMDAANPYILIASRDDPSVPPNLRWEKEGVFTFAFFWIVRRLLPFLRTFFFQLTAVFLTAMSWLLQFGFTYFLDQKLGGFDILDDDNAKNICATSGLVQLISVGFFLAFMLGQVPSLIKNATIVLTATKETDDARGPEGARKLWIDSDGGYNEDQVELRLKESQMADSMMYKLLPDRHQQELTRTKTNHTIRRMLAFCFPVAEAIALGYLVYVGVKYIFWSGFYSLEQPDDGQFPNYDAAAEEGQWPWMSNTLGVEELIMATLALQFVVDIDETIFKLVFPKSVQNAVCECKLDCAGWLPTEFRARDFVNIGKHHAEQAIRDKDRTIRQANRDLVRWGSKSKSEKEQWAHRTLTDASGKPPEEDDISWRIQDRDRQYDTYKEADFTRQKELLKEEEDGALSRSIAKQFLMDKDYDDEWDAMGGHIRAQQLKQLFDDMDTKEREDASLHQQQAPCLSCGPGHASRTKALPLQAPADDDARALFELAVKLRQNKNCLWKLYMRALKDIEFHAKFVNQVVFGDDVDPDKVQSESAAYLYDVSRLFIGGAPWAIQPNDGASVAPSVFPSIISPSENDPNGGLWMSTSHKFWDQAKAGSPGEAKIDEKELGRFLKLFQKKCAEVVKKSRETDSTGTQLAQEAFENVRKVDQANEGTSLRLMWLNLLPNATVLVAYLLIIVPIFVVVFIRARMGCISFEPVDLDALGSIDKMTDEDTFEVHWGMTTALVIASSIFVVSFVDLCIRIRWLWTIEEVIGRDGQSVTQMQQKNKTSTAPGAQS